jgi:hypothetical protein
LLCFALLIVVIIGDGFGFPLWLPTTTSSAVLRYTALSRACNGDASVQCGCFQTPYTVAGGAYSCVQRAKQQARVCPWHGI